MTELLQGTAWCAEKPLCLALIFATSVRSVKPIDRGWFKPFVSCQTRLITRPHLIPRCAPAPAAIEACSRDTCGTHKYPQGATPYKVNGI